MYEPPRAALLPDFYRAIPVHPACAIVLALTLLFSGCSLVPAYSAPMHRLPDASTAPRLSHSPIPRRFEANGGTRIKIPG